LWLPEKVSLSSYADKAHVFTIKCLITLDKLFICSLLSPLLLFGRKPAGKLMMMLEGKTIFSSVSHSTYVYSILHDIYSIVLLRFSSLIDTVFGI
jgi:hypothetical protein